ncbi:MAG: hypothetical protein KDM91_00800 [Verrucomicrobiae bacterium]|nr:hypothetical protein [Verrucomicrobiae bacterium]MCP5539921.1 hypothetical protein [Akkermansiaceae bacterium]
MDFEVVKWMAQLPRRERKTLHDRFLEIREFPGNFADFHEFDATGRRVEVHICGKFAIRFWDDFADRHLKILDVTLADRGA